MEKPTIDMLEEVYTLNFSARFTNVIEFSSISWNLTNATIGLAHSGTITPRQRVSLLTLGKSKRLLRSIQKLVLNGNAAEAEILSRSLVELQMLIFFILDDSSNKRAEDWLEGKKWHVKELMENYERIYKNHYANTSFYAHNNARSLSKYVVNTENGFTMLDGPVGGGEENFRKAAKVLGDAAMTNAGLCEILSRNFEMTSAWEEAHRAITETPYYKQQLTKAMDVLPEIGGEIEMMTKNM